MPAQEKAAAGLSEADVTKRVEQAVAAAREEERGKLDEVVKAAVADALANVQGAQADVEPEADLVTRIVSGQFVSYKKRSVLFDGTSVIGYATAYAGEKAELFPDDEARLDELGMLVPKGGHLATSHGDIDRLSDDDLYRFFVESKPTVDDVLRLAADDPARAQRLLAAEQRQENPRKGITEHLESFIRQEAERQA